MCGICGIFSGTDNADLIKIENMMSVLAHRGPDGRGVYADHLCLLGHQRLAIIDLSDKGRQPMGNETGTIRMVVNGEIYNYKELRKILESQGHLFKSDCDSETIIHAYEQYGDSFLDRLDGMFALAIYDKRRGRILLARDPVGKKPLYYHWDGKRLVFASEIKALFDAGVPKEVNYDAIPSWLLYQYTIGEETMFKGVKKLAAGCMLTIENETKMAITPYWSIRYLGTIQNGEEAVEALRGCLEESVRLRLRSDVPVGAFLSGGVDSSAVVALYRKFTSGLIHTFTASFESKSESKYAKKVSDYLETEYHEVLITADMVYRDLRKIAWHYDEPLGEAATICNYYLAQEAKKYVTVVLAGEGGDELFGGYPWHRYASLLESVNRVPHWARGPVTAPISGDVTSRFYPYERMLMLLDQRSLGELLLYPTTATSHRSVEWLTGKPFKHDTKFRELKTTNTLNRMLGSDFLNLLPEKFLMKADKGTMAHAIEERLPLLDKYVVELAFMISPKLKQDKWVFRKAVEDLLPAEITWRPKQGFGTPVGEWLGIWKIKELAIDRIGTGQLLYEVCRPAALEKITGYLSSHSGKTDKRLSLGATNVIWSLLALQLWWDIWFRR